MNCKQVQELLPLYVSRDLEEKDAQIIQAHVESCAACAASCDEYRETRQLLQEFAPPMFSEAVYEGIRQNVLREIPPESSASSRALPKFVASLFPRRLTWALAATVLLAVALSAVYFIANRKGAQTNDQRFAGGRDVVDRPAAPPTNEQEQHPAEKPRRERIPVPELAGVTHQFERRKNDVTNKRAPSVAAKSPDNTQLIAEAARTSNNPANRDAVTVGDSSKTEKALRMEIQTKDPNIRIIWFSAQPAKQDSPNKFSKGI